MNIYVLTWEHKYGLDVWAFASRERAEEKRISIAEEWFDTECSHLEKPKDREELANLYFDTMGMSTSRPEFCWITECELED